MKRIVACTASIAMVIFTISAQYYSIVNTFAGTTVAGLLDGTLGSARFDRPYSLCIDRPTNTIYVADGFNNCIRKIQGGEVTTLAGNGVQGDQDGQGANARFYLPTGVDFFDGHVYVCDDGNHKIKRIDAQGNVVTIAGTGLPGTTDGPALSSKFYNPTEVRVNSTGVIYVSDYGNNTIRKIENGTVSTLAGLAGAVGDQLGQGSAVRFNRPTGLALDDQDNLYVADQVNCKIKKVTADGVVTLLAGSGQEASVNGTGDQASFMRPTYLGWDPTGALMLCEWEGNVVRRVTIGGVVNTVAGTGVSGYNDGPVAQAMFNAPYGVCVDEDGNGYIGDKLNNCIRILYKDGEEPQGIAEVRRSSALTLYPDPSHDVLYVDMSAVKEPISNLMVLDASGAIVMSVDQVVGAHRSSTPLSLPVESFAQGRYTLLIGTSSGQYKGAFIKE